MASYGIGPPWKLTPRRIPLHRQKAVNFAAVHNVNSSIPQQEWERVLLKGRSRHEKLLIPAGSKHHPEISMAHHTTAFLDFNFTRPKSAGSSLRPVLRML